MNGIPSPVLVVDDSGVQRQYMMELCRTVGADTVLEADGGPAALKILGERGATLKLLIVDLEMPEIDGVQVMEEVLNLGLTLPVIVASSRESALLSSIETMCADLGVNLICALPKPLTIASLSMALSRLNKQIEAEAPSKQHHVDLSVRDVILALQEHQFHVLYQPKVALADGSLKGVESLIRWQHPDKGLLMPSCFIDYIERTPLIHDVTLEVLDLALAQCLRWQAQGSTLSVSVNLSARSLGKQGFVDTIIERVKASGISPNQLVLEITETAIMADLGVALSTLARLRLKGFGLSIDDFGTGFSSMQQLSRAPFTELKIDRAFVHGAHQRSHLRIMLESTIDMARKLNLIVVAEGVENIEDWALLQALGCELAQGYYVAKPMPGENLLEWYRKHQSRLSAEVEQKKVARE